MHRSCIHTSSYFPLTVKRTVRAGGQNKYTVSFLQSVQSLERRVKWAGLHERNGTCSLPFGNVLGVG